VEGDGKHSELHHTYGVCAVLNSLVETIFDNVSTAKLPRLKAALFCLFCR